MKPTIKLLESIFTILLINSAFSTNAFAIAVYEYQGNPFTAFHNPAGVLPSGLSSISGEMTLSETLVPNMPFSSVNLITMSFSFTDGATVITNDTPDIKWNTWVRTDEYANIVEWDLNVFTYPTQAGDVSFASRSYIGQGGPTEDFTAYWIDDTQHTSNLANVDNNPGTWITRVVPLPATVWLLSSGLLGLIGISRRRTKAA